MQEAKPRASSLVVRALPLIFGLTALATGVALNETGISLGRTVILVGLPLALVGLIVIALPRKQLPAKVVYSGVPPAEAIAAATERWGLTVESPHRVRGRVRGRHAEITASKGRWPVRIYVAVQRPLDMGLTVQRGAKVPGDARKEHKTGDMAFDRDYCVRADETPRVDSLLTPRLREQLLSAHASLDDDGVEILLGESNGEAVIDTVRLAGWVASELERASVKVPPAEALVGTREAWLSFAQEQKLATADTPLSMWGTIEGVEVQARSVRDSFRNFHFELSAAFPQPLGRGLSLKPASSATQFDRTGEPVGHPAFDKNFSLSTTDSVDAARLVGPETRLALLDLRDAGLQLRADDEGLWAWVGFKPTEVDQVPHGLRRLAQIALRIAGNAERFPPNG
ncbi:MAG: hypothetical protein KC731_25600 [Myxococcales bacterium]|nr:hypothetical protein [Myxococcales bacterium]